MKINKKEIWKINTRGFNGIVEMLEDVNDTNEDNFIKVKILEGKKRYLSVHRHQEGIGEEISIRTTLTNFIGKEDLKNETKN